MASVHLAITFLISTALLACASGETTTRERGKILNPGTNYEVNTDDIITYSQLGQPCDPAVQKDINRKEGVCRATLFCNPETRLCDCEDIGPYKYTEQFGKCKNIVGSACYSTSDCVANAFCKRSVCVCPVGSSCVRAKRPVRRFF
jgi:methylaspartate ammonia-lyase